MTLPDYLADFTPKQLRRRNELKPKLRCRECKDLLLIGESGLVCGRAHGRIHGPPLGTSMGELTRLFPELTIEHRSMAERQAAMKGLNE